MKKLRFVAFGLFAVCVFSLSATAQTGSYYADNGKEGEGRRDMWITITQKPNGYEVSGEYRINARGLQDALVCPISGQFHPNTGRFRATAKCGDYVLQPGFDSNVIIPEMDMSRKVRIGGFKRDQDRFQITEPFSMTAWLGGAKRKEGGTNSESTDTPRSEIPQKMEESEGPFTGTWTLLSGNQFEAKWSNGAHAILTIAKFDSEGVLIIRGDTAASVSAGFSAVYSGKISGNSVSGKVVFTQNGQTWEGTWSAKW